MTPKQLHILQHSLGLDQYGQGSFYRNHFVTGPGSDDYDDCKELARNGLMVMATVTMMSGGDHAFFVTDEGKKAVSDESLKPPKLTKAQKRYRSWLEADCNMSFGEWLKWEGRLEFL